MTSGPVSAVSNTLRRLRSGLGSVFDNTEKAVFSIRPSDDVYSFFMFVAPTEHKKEGSSFASDTIMSCLLVLINTFMQGMLLFAIFNKIVVGNIEWQNGIVKID